MTIQRINLAFVGSGGWARKHHFPALDYLRKSPETADFELNLHGIYSLEPEVASAVADQYGFARVYSDLQALIDDQAVNAVAVAVTPKAAASVIEQLIVRRIPIFSEKPPGVSTEEAEKLSRIVDVPNVLAFNRRYEPLNNTFREIVDGMEDITFVEGHFFRHHRLDEEFMIGTGIHWVNFMAYLFGEIRQMRVARWQNPQNETWLWVAHLIFEGGLRGILKVFPCTGSDIERVEVHTNESSAYLHGALSEYPGKIVIDSGKSRQTIDPQAEQQRPEIVRLGIVNEYLEFFQVVLDRATSRSTFQNAVNSMRVAEAMQLGIDLV
ncbi:MAG: Gfo/Idh/MocA family protein [Anaerolineae bacterium]